MGKTYIYEANQPVSFVDEKVGKSGAILGKLHAPFFDLNHPTRNGRDYSEAAEKSLQSDLFKEKMATRTFFGRLGHPMTDDEAAEDPAVRACVVLTECEKNPSTNMYEGTLEILNNKYGQQLKSLIDAGCVMGVSTRGSGDSYEAADGSEKIRDYEFEALDVVTLPAVKSARVQVVESLDKNKRKSLEELVNSSTDQSMLEALKVTIESSEMPEKKKLLETINKKLSSGSETIESLVNEIAKLSAKVCEAEKARSEAESKLAESGSSTETIENGQSSKVNESLSNLLRESAIIIDSMKKSIARKSSLLSEAQSLIENIQKDNSDLKSQVAQITEDFRRSESEVKSYRIANRKLDEDLSKAQEELKSLRGVSKSLESINESLVSEKKSKKELSESVESYKKRYESLEKAHSELASREKALLARYIESVAVAEGISLSELKEKSRGVTSFEKVDSIARSIRESIDAKQLALPQVESLGRMVDSRKYTRVQVDPELDRAARIAQLVNKNK